MFGMPKSAGGRLSDFGAARKKISVFRRESLLSVGGIVGGPAADLSGMLDVSLGGFADDLADDGMLPGFVSDSLQEARRSGKKFGSSPPRAEQQRRAVTPALALPAVGGTAGDQSVSQMQSAVVPGGGPPPVDKRIGDRPGPTAGRGRTSGISLDGNRPSTEENDPSNYFPSENENLSTKKIGGGPKLTFADVATPTAAPIIIPQLFERATGIGAPRAASTWSPERNLLTPVEVDDVLRGHLDNFAELFDVAPDGLKFDADELLQRMLVDNVLSPSQRLSTAAQGRLLGAPGGDGVVERAVITRATSPSRRNNLPNGAEGSPVPPEEGIIDEEDSIIDEEDGIIDESGGDFQMLRDGGARKSEFPPDIQMLRDGGARKSMPIGDPVLLKGGEEELPFGLRSAFRPGVGKKKGAVPTPLGRRSLGTFDEESGLGGSGDDRLGGGLLRLSEENLKKFRAPEVDLELPPPLLDQRSLKGFDEGTSAASHLRRQSELAKNAAVEDELSLPKLGAKNAAVDEHIMSPLMQASILADHRLSLAQRHQILSHFVDYPGGQHVNFEAAKTPSLQESGDESHFFVGRGNLDRYSIPGRAVLQPNSDMPRPRPSFLRAGPSSAGPPRTPAEKKKGELHLMSVRRDEDANRFLELEEEFAPSQPNSQDDAALRKMFKSRPTKELFEDAVSLPPSAVYSPPASRGMISAGGGPAGLPSQEHYSQEDENVAHLNLSAMKIFHRALDVLPRQEIQVLPEALLKAQQEVFQADFSQSGIKEAGGEVKMSGGKLPDIDLDSPLGGGFEEGFAPPGASQGSMSGGPGKKGSLGGGASSVGGLSGGLGGGFDDDFGNLSADFGNLSAISEVPSVDGLPRDSMVGPPQGGLLFGRPLRFETPAQTQKLTAEANPKTRLPMMPPSGPPPSKRKRKNKNDKKVWPKDDQIYVSADFFHRQDSFTDRALLNLAVSEDFDEPLVEGIDFIISHWIVAARVRSSECS